MGLNPYFKLYSLNHNMLNSIELDTILIKGKEIKERLAASITLFFFHRAPPYHISLFQTYPNIHHSLQEHLYVSGRVHSYNAYHMFSNQGHTITSDKTSTKN